ncbi:MAG: 16S rRNA (cytosine(967)-C(5))-methyltransferase RsmB [Clostridia bacterium]|nr:16S rRNA (cytosine(967)-C(5))-methyltransferase RsmB [Clostridia bacterium]
MPNPRKSAVKALIKVEADGGFSNLVIDNVIKQDGLVGADSALATALFYGVLDRKITIDYILSNYSKQPIKKLPYYVAAALRIGVFQLLYMDKIPPFAAINESVNLVKRSKNANSSGYVNAVLRKVDREGREILPDDDSVKSISIRYSFPEWIVIRFVSQFGIEKTKDIFTEMLKKSDVYLRVNNTKISVDDLIDKLHSEGVETEKAEIENSLKVISSLGAIDSLSSYKNGYFHVQDLSSQICAASLDLGENMKALDICAAPGGKSFTAAEIMNGTGEVVSCDLYEHRVKLISSGAKRLSLNNIKTLTADALVYNNELGEFDRVLCDAPCSGLGIIGRKPDIKFKNEDEIKDLPEIQYNILKNAAKYVRPNGKIVYSTCTVLREENEDVFDRFISSNPHFKVISKLTILPSEKGGDGFFIAVAERID